MRRNFVLPLFVLALVNAIPAAADIPVADHGTLDQREKRDDNTDGLETVDKERFSIDRNVTCSMYRPGRRNDPVGAAKANPEIAGLVRRVAREEGIDENQFLALVYQESRFNPCARSPVGATGLAQLMPGTADGLRVNSDNIEENLRGGARYYKQQLRRFDGNVTLALAAYNSGPGSVEKYRGIPPFKETQGYVGDITKKWLPAFGGSDKANIPLNYGGGGTAYAGMRDSTIHAMATSQATGDSLGNVASWLRQLGGLRSGTILDSWDHNSGARNANLEMVNTAIRLGSSMADLINARNAVTAANLSGASQTTDFIRDKDISGETTAICKRRADADRRFEWDAEAKACVERREREIQVELQRTPE